MSWRILKLAMRAQLGNQMFQYAAVRTIAEETKSRLFLGYPEASIADHARLLLGRTRRPALQLRRYFQLLGDRRVSQALNRICWYGKRLVSVQRRHSPDYQQLAPDVFSEKPIDLYSVVDNADVEYQGWFQSEKYFLRNRDAVLQWFLPTAESQKQIDKTEEFLGIPGSERCCIHVRRGDYLKIEDGLAGPHGWVLPLEYYQNAWENIPAGICPIIITDDPEYCQRVFGWLPEARVVRDTSPIVDMFLMRNSHYKIIANSTFSWWGAWLSEDVSGLTYIPHGFFGFRRKIWVPIGIRPANSRWIDVSCGEALGVDG